jgi:hypothetical protein
VRIVCALVERDDSMQSPDVSMCSSSGSWRPVAASIHQQVQEGLRLVLPVRFGRDLPDSLQCPQHVFRIGIASDRTACRRLAEERSESRDDLLACARI